MLLYKESSILFTFQAYCPASSDTESVTMLFEIMQIQEALSCKKAKSPWKPQREAHRTAPNVNVGRALHGSSKNGESIRSVPQLSKCFKSSCDFYGLSKETHSSVGRATINRWADTFGYKYLCTVGIPHTRQRLTRRSPTSESSKTNRSSNRILLEATIAPCPTLFYPEPWFCSALAIFHYVSSAMVDDW